MTHQLPPNYIDPNHPEEDRKLLACQAEGGTSDGVILRGLKAVDCPACEGTPKPGNQPCAVCGRPAPVPAEGEVAELVEWLRGANWDRKRQTLATRAADLLEQLNTAQVSQPVPDCERNWDSVLSPSGGYEMDADAALRDGAQLVNGEWWAPVFGCDSLESVLARIRERLQRQAAPLPDRLPELRGMFERILCVARSSDQKPVGNIELADRLIKAVVSWGALPVPQGEVE